MAAGSGGGLEDSGALQAVGSAHHYQDPDPVHNGPAHRQAVTADEEAVPDSRLPHGRPAVETTGAVGALRNLGRLGRNQEAVAALRRRRAVGGAGASTSGASTTSARGLRVRAIPEAL